MSDATHTALRPCPFCGGPGDPEGWMSCEPDGSNKKTGPACDECGGSTDTVARWNNPALLRRVEELEAALRPFADFADPNNRIPPDIILTAGSAMARKQITMANCYAARAALSTTDRGES